MDASPTFLPGDGVPGLVSVIVPTFNRAYIVGRTIRSALDQSYPNVEVLVADDGSTDDTRAVVSAIADPRVRYLHQANAGCPAARNFAIRHARGEFIALLDSDDQWVPQKLEIQVALLRRFPEVGMVWSDMSAVDDEGRIRELRHIRSFYGAYRTLRIEDVMTRRATVRELVPGAGEAIADCPVYTGELLPQMLVGSLVHTPTVLLRRERVRQTGGFDETMRPTGEDYDFHLHTTMLGPVAFVDAPLILYRVGNEDQLTAPHMLLAMARADLRTMTKWLARARERAGLPQSFVNQRLARSHGWIGYELYQGGAMGEARRHLLRSLRYQPRQPRAAMLVLASFLPAPLLRLARRAKRTIMTAAR